jgi:hypothetical protein
MLLIAVNGAEELESYGFPLIGEFPTATAA